MPSFAIILGLSLVTQAILKLKWLYYPVVLLAIYLIGGGWKKAVVWVKTLPRDVKYLSFAISLGAKGMKALKENKTIPVIFADLCTKHQSRVALIDAETGHRLTFLGVDQFANQLGNLFLKNGYCYGDCVAIMADSSPEFVCYWLGLAKVGVVAALINVNLQEDSLAHCLNACNAKAIIFDIRFSDVVQRAKALQKCDLEYYCTSAHNIEGTHDLGQLLLNSQINTPPKPEGQNMESKLLYLFTSGTTGMPKAAIITHMRCFLAGYGLVNWFGAKEGDTLYLPLPLQHAMLGLGGLGCFLTTGIPAVIRKKFSASRFIDDCIKYNCTVSFYIGESCRYLLSQPQRQQDTQHSLRLMIGTGLKANVWAAFKRRFNIPIIGEFYGSTEGIGLINTVGKEGAVGFFPQIVPQRLLATLVQVDVDTGEIVRGSDGFCVQCKPWEPGELVSPLSNEIGRQFDGYLDDEATQKKKFFDVFKKGDAFVRTGDIFCVDELGFLYFHDRLGDTFRWKGENVSTSEVEGIITKHLGLKDVVAYGVPVPGTEGKAGMITLADPDKQVDIPGLAAQLKKILPSYARPLFARRTNSVSVTETFKYKKVELRKDGFDVHKMKGDDIFVLDTERNEYKTLDLDLYNSIMAGSVTL